MSDVIALAEGRQPACDTSKLSCEESNLDFTDEDKDIEDGEDNGASRNRRVLRILPRVVRIGGYMAPIRGKVLLTSKGIILCTSTVEGPEPTKDVRLKVKTADMNGVWAYHGRDDGSRGIILYLSRDGARKVRRTLNMHPADRILPPGSAANWPFFSPRSKLESQRRIIIFLDTWECEYDEVAKLWEDIKGIRGDPFYRPISTRKARSTLTQAMKCKSPVGNGAPSLQIEDLSADCTVRHVHDTVWFCLLCKGTPNEPVLCPRCSGIFCTSCYSETPNCPYCYEKVMDTGLLGCRWVEDLGARLKLLLAAEWGNGNAEVIQTIIEACQNVKCRVCDCTVMDAMFMPGCMKMFCRRCVKASMALLPPHSLSFIDTKKNNLVRSAWREDLRKIVDKLLVAPDAAYAFYEFSNSEESCDESGLESEDASLSDADMEDAAAVHAEVMDHVEDQEEEDGYDSDGMDGSDAVFDEGDN